MKDNLNNHYPLIDKDAIHDLISKSNKLAGIIRVGETNAYILTGKRSISKRTFLLRDTDGKVGYMHATGLAAFFGCMGGLLKWYEENKGWKDGGYFVR